MKIKKLKMLFLIIGVILTINVSGQIQFEKLNPSPFEGLALGDNQFADIDGDNDLDIIISGWGPLGRKTRLYENDGIGNYTLIIGTPFYDVFAGSTDFADVDGDGDLDFFQTGADFGNNNHIANLFFNDGSGNFTQVFGNPFVEVFVSDAEFADLDGDSDLDLIVTGQNNAGQYTANLYINDGSGNFSIANTPFTGVYYSSIAIADINGDGDLDVFISGHNTIEKTAFLYENDGSGSFSINTESIIEGVYKGDAVFSDVNGDNYPDLTICGENNSNSRISQLYINNGTGIFALVNGTPFDGILSGSLGYADIDSDNDLDLIISGENNSLDRTAALYNNDGNGNFSLVTVMPFNGGIESTIGLGDIDGDNDQDLIIQGKDALDQPFSDLYINNSTPSAPVVPLSDYSILFTFLLMLSAVVFSVIKKLSTYQ